MLQTPERFSSVLQPNPKRKLTLPFITQSLISLHLWTGNPNVPPLGMTTTVTFTSRTSQPSCSHSSPRGPATRTPNSHLDERASPAPEQKRTPVTLPAQRPSPLPRPTTLPFSFEGTTLAPCSVQVGKASGPVRSQQPLSHCDWFRYRLVISSRPIRNNELQVTDFCWNDWQGDTLFLGLPSEQNGSLELLGAIFATPREETQKDPNMETINQQMETEP